MYTDFQAEIVKVFNPREYLTWSEVVARLQKIKKNSIRLNSGYYRAWQDLSVNGRMDRGLNSGMYQENSYRINQ